MNEPEEAVTSPTSESDQVELQPQSATLIAITSTNNLELTITKTCLEVLNNLGKAFADAMKTTEVKKIEYISPYKVLNETGIPVTLVLDKSAFNIYGSEDSNAVILESEAAAALQLKPSLESSSTVHLQRAKGDSEREDKGRFLHVQVFISFCLFLKIK